MSVPEELRALMARKADMEQELQVHEEYLTQPGMPGLTGGLVDDEGFPHPHLDHMAIRNARNRVACLRTDYRKVMDDIEKGLHSLHAEGAVHVPPTASRAGPSGSGDTASVVTLQPFALLDEVSPGSPAAEAGLQVNDRVLQIGDVGWRNPSVPVSEVFQQVAALVRSSENVQLPVCVVRGGENLNLQLCPRKWSGQGLLGCHLSKLPA